MSHRDDSIPNVRGCRAYAWLEKALWLLLDKDYSCGRFSVIARPSGITVSHSQWASTLVSAEAPEARKGKAHGVSRGWSSRRIESPVGATAGNAQFLPPLPGLGMGCGAFPRLAPWAIFSTGPPGLRHNEHHQPSGRPLFCSSNHFTNGWKYAIMAEPSILRLPVNASSASGHGLDAPISSI